MKVRTGGRTAFSVDSCKDSPLTHVAFNHFDAEAKVADGSTVAVEDSDTVTGLPSK
jgi:hypothetical protein